MGESSVDDVAIFFVSHPGRRTLDECYEVLHGRSRTHETEALNGCLALSVGARSGDAGDG